MADDQLSSPKETPTTEAPNQDRPMGPLTPMFLVWPGRRDGGSWSLLWFGFAFLLSGLLPWHGHTDQVVVTKSGQVMTVLDLEYAKAMAAAYKEAGRDPITVPEIASVSEPAQRSVGSVLVLLCGIAMVVAGAVNVFHQRLVLFTPVLLSMVVVALVLWFTFAVHVSAEGKSYNAQPVRALQHLGSMLPSLIGLFSEPGAPGVAMTDHDLMTKEFGVFGLGVNVALFADLLLFVFLAITIVSALMKPKKDEPAKGGGNRRRPTAPRR